MIVSCKITLPSGGELDLNQGVYRLTAQAFEGEQVVWRRHDVQNPFVEGTWTVNGVRENVVAPLDVWIRGASTAETEAAVTVLTDALSQRNFNLDVTFDGSRRIYNCYVSDYVVKRTRELRHAFMAQVTANVPRHPTWRES